MINRNAWKRNKLIKVTVEILPKAMSSQIAISNAWIKHPAKNVEGEKN